MIRPLEGYTMLPLCNKNILFLDRIVILNEQLILYDNRKQTFQWLDHEEKRKHFPKPKWHQQKVLLTDWTSNIGIFHDSFLNCNQINYASVSCQQLIRSSKIRPSQVNRSYSNLVKDNSLRNNTTKSIQIFLGIQIIRDLA